MEPTSVSRHVFDRAVAFAYIRWEILRRTATYRRQVCHLLKFGAEAFFSRSGSHRWDEARLTAWALQHWGGVIPVPADRISEKSGDSLSVEGRRLHAHVLKTYGLRVVLHYSVMIPPSDMAALPVFSDTPTQQPEVVDSTLLRRLVRHLGPHGEIPHRSLHKAVQLRHVDPAGFVIRGRRIHPTFGRDMQVFDYRVQRWTPSEIAAALGLTEREERRAWARACDLVGDVEVDAAQPDDGLWAAVAAHCEACRLFVSGEGEPCAATAHRLDLGSTGQRERITSGRTLDLIGARVAGVLPARSSRAHLDSVAPAEDDADL